MENKMEAVCRTTLNAPTHWLHKTPNELLDYFASTPVAANTEIPDPIITAQVDASSAAPRFLDIQLHILHMNKIYQVQNLDWTFSAPTFRVNTLANPDASWQPLSELILEVLLPHALEGKLLMPEFLEMDLNEPLMGLGGDADAGEQSAYLAIMIGMRGADQNWMLGGWNMGAWMDVASCPWVGTYFGGAAMSRMACMDRGREIATENHRDRQLLRIIRCLGHRLRLAELMQRMRHVCVAIVEPIDHDKPAHPRAGLLLMLVSPGWMDRIKASDKVMHVTALVTYTWQVVGWIDRRPRVEEAALMETDWVTKMFFDESSGLSKGAWLDSRHEDPAEFFLKTEAELPATSCWDPKTVMPT